MRKSNKAKRADKLNVQHAKDAAYSQEIKERPATWSGPDAGLLLHGAVPGSGAAGTAEED